MCVITIKCLLASSLFFAPASFRGEPQADSTASLTVGDRLRAKRRWLEAAKAYDKAYEEAKAAAAEATYRSGLAYNALIEEAQRQPGTKEEAVTEYREEAARRFSRVLEEGTKAQQVLARTHLGLQHLRVGNLDEALRILDVIEVADLSRGQRAVHYYNLGRVHEAKGSIDPAVKYYKRSVNEQPLFRRSEERMRALIAEGKVDAEVCANWLQALLEAGHGESAVDQALSLLEHGRWTEGPVMMDLLAIPVGYSRRAPSAPVAFERKIRSRLRRVAVKTPALQEPIDEIEKAIHPELPYFDRSAVRSAFPSWLQSKHRGTFAKFLKSVGDYYYQYEPEQKRSRSPRQALASYSAAWAMDNTDTEAAVYIAAVLRDYANDLGADGYYYMTFMNDIFMQKGHSYRIELKDANDWERILRLHFLLGTIFEERKEWGSENDMRSAVFQWTLALEAQHRLRRLKPDFPETPTLREHLATAYDGAGRSRRAIEQWMEAAELYDAMEDFQAGSRAYAMVKRLEGPLSPSQAQRVDDYNRLNDLPGALRQRHILVFTDHTILGPGKQQSLKADFHGPEHVKGISILAKPMDASATRPIVQAFAWVGDRRVEIGHQAISKQDGLMLVSFAVDLRDVTRIELRAAAVGSVVPGILIQHVSVLGPG